MANKKYFIGKAIGKAVIQSSKVLPFNGNSYPGYIFTKICGITAIKELEEKRLEIGSVLVTGTNGKTTTTTMIHDLLSKDVNLVGSANNNTIYAVITALLREKGELGVFEYGIRDLKHGMPDTMQKVMNPVGVVYTNISREHTQVANVKNPFEDYVLAKTLLSKEMKNGVVMTNADDPRTNFIGQNKEKDGKVIYYGLNIDYEDIFENPEIKCPKCGEILEYTKVYMNHRGEYSCKCGFKRNKPDITINKVETVQNKWKIQIDGDIYNYNIKKNIKFTVGVTIPMFGLYNLYNIMCSAATYACFTTKPENIEVNLKNYYNSLGMDILPPGRFEIFDADNKMVGLGQGDNGDAIIANCTLMKMNIKDKFEFIYTTPDEFEEEIFEDHKKIVCQMKPDHLVVVPGRVSIEAAEKFYEELKKEVPDAEFIPLKYDLNERIEKLSEYVRNSDYNSIIITGCGDEYAFWDLLKNNLKK